MRKAFLASLTVAAIMLLGASALEAQWWPYIVSRRVAGTGCGSGSSTYTGPGDLYAFDRWAGLRAYNRATADNCLPLFDLVTAVGGTVHTVHSLTTGLADVADAAAFCGGGVPPCFIKQIYEYASGSSLNFASSPATPGPYPSLTFNCIGTYPCAQKDPTVNAALLGAGVTPATGIVFFSMVSAWSASNNTNQCSQVIETPGRNMMRRGSSGGGITPNVNMVGGGGLGSVDTTAGFHTANGFIAGVNTKLMIDGADNSLSQPAGNDTVAGATSGILDTAPNPNVTCYGDEWGWKDNDQPSAIIRKAISDNQRAFYGI